MIHVTMLFDPSHWELVKRLRKDKVALLEEYQTNGIILPKLNPPTSFNYKLSTGRVGIMGLLMNPVLSSQEERDATPRPSMDAYKENIRCEVAQSIIDDFPAIAQMYWTVLTPGARVNPHYGVEGVLRDKVASHWRIQMCWFPGENAEFHLEDSYLKYKEDLCFGFADGMEKHWAVNNGAKPRTVMIIDVWRDKVESADIPHPDTILK